MPAKLRVPAIIFAAGVAAWIANAALLWLSGAPLGHDEAQYAIAAQDLLAGEPPRWFYVSSGMSAVAIPGVLGGGGELAMRFAPLVFGLAFVLATAALARRVCGDLTAAWVVAVLAGARSFMKLSAELLSDLPATTCLVAGTLVIVAEVTREAGPRWRTVAAAPLLAAALYLRYASCVPIAILGATVLGLCLGRIARRPWPIVATAAVFLVLLVPHARAAIAATGSPLGILLDSKDVPQHTWIGQGLATYLGSNPFTYFGLLMPPVLLGGVLALRRGASRAAVILWIVAVADIIAIGLITHAQVRYILFGTTLLAILGVDTLRAWLAARPAHVRRIAGGAAVAAVVVAWIVVGIGQARHGAARRKRTDATLTAAAAIRDDAGGVRCHVLGDAFTQLEWYSRCRSSSWPWDALARREPIYLVRTPTSLPTDPNELRGTPRTILEARDVTVIRFDP